MILFFRMKFINNAFILDFICTYLTKYFFIRKLKMLIFRKNKTLNKKLNNLFEKLRYSSKI